jgi:hypothetical protein
LSHAARVAPIRRKIAAVMRYSEAPIYQMVFIGQWHVKFSSEIPARRPHNGSPSAWHGYFSTECGPAQDLSEQAIKFSAGICRSARMIARDVKYPVDGTARERPFLPLHAITEPAPVLRCHESAAQSKNRRAT